MFFQCKYVDLQDIDVKLEQEDDEPLSANSSDLQLIKSDDDVTDREEEDEEDCPNKQINIDGKIEEITDILQCPEYEPETNNNDCKFYKQSLAKQALAGVF